ncbi:MAG: hypothetical protein RIE08_08420 [Acidimicrobiales bacterium]
MDFATLLVVTIVVGLAVGRLINTMLHHIGLGAGRPGVEWLCLATWLLVGSISATLVPDFDSNPWGSGTRLGIMAALAIVPVLRLSMYRYCMRVTEAPPASTPVPAATIPSWAETLVAEAVSGGWRVIEITETPRVGRAVELTREGSACQLSIARVPRSAFTFFLKAPVAITTSVTTDGRGLVASGNVGIHLVDHDRCLAQWARDASLTELVTAHERLLQRLRSAGVGFATFTSTEAHEHAADASCRSLTEDRDWRTRAATGVDRMLTTRHHEPSAADIAEFVRETKGLAHLPPPPLGPVTEPPAGPEPTRPAPLSGTDTARWRQPG